MDTRLDVAFLPHHSISATSCRTSLFEVTSCKENLLSKGHSTLRSILYRMFL